MPHGSLSSSTKRTLDAWSLTCDRRCSSSMTPYRCFQQTQTVFRLKPLKRLFILVEVCSVAPLHWIMGVETAVVSVVNSRLECQQLSTSTVVPIPHITQPVITYCHYPAQPPLQQLQHHKHRTCCHNTPRNRLPDSPSQEKWDYSSLHYHKRSSQCAASSTVASSRSCSIQKHGSSTCKIQQRCWTLPHGKGGCYSSVPCSISTEWVCPFCSFWTKSCSFWQQSHGSWEYCIDYTLFPNTSSSPPHLHRPDIRLQTDTNYPRTNGHIGCCSYHPVSWRSHCMFRQYLVFTCKELSNPLHTTCERGSSQCMRRLHQQNRPDSMYRTWHSFHSG